MTNRKPIDESTLLEEVRRYLKALRCTTMAGELANMLGVGRTLKVPPKRTLI